MPALKPGPVLILKNVYEIYLTMKMTFGMSAMIGNEPPPTAVITPLAVTSRISRGGALYATATFPKEKYLA